MSDETYSPSEKKRAVRAAEEVDAICSAFDAAWRAGQIPRLEEFLSQRDESGVETLLPELLAVEIEYRRKSGTPATVEEIVGRLSQHRDLVRNYFRVHVSAVDGEEATVIRPGATDDTHISPRGTKRCATENDLNKASASATTNCCMRSHAAGWESSTKPGSRS